MVNYAISCYQSNTHFNDQYSFFTILTPLFKHASGFTFCLCYWLDYLLMPEPLTNLNKRIHKNHGKS